MEHSVANGLKLCKLVKGGLCLLFLLSVFLPLRLGAQTAGDPYQLRFDAGATALFSGNYENAAQIFEALYKETKSPRVKLEWARAAFLLGNYDLSRKLFEEVQSEQIPDTVRFNVSLFLTEISKLSSYTDYGFTFVRDTNPFVVSRSQQINIFGIPFDYTPPVAQQTLNGLRFLVSNSSVLAASGRVRLISELDATKYEGSKNDRSALRLALQYSPDQQKLFYRLGVDHYQQRSELLLRQPYISVTYRFNQLASKLSHWELEARIGKNMYPDFPEINGGVRSLNIVGRRNLSANLQAIAGIYYDDTQADWRSQSYETRSATLGLRVFSETVASAIQLSYSATARNFKDIDELFALTRRDRREFIMVLVQPYQLRVGNLYPSLEIGSEVNRSNIPISSFRKSIINFGLRKNF